MSNPLTTLPVDSLARQIVSQIPAERGLATGVWIVAEHIRSLAASGKLSEANTRTEQACELLRDAYRQGLADHAEKN